MTILQSLILGIIQGITEFLPISSSAHLVLFPFLVGWQLDEEFAFSFNVLVQIGTLVAVIVYYREDIRIILKAMARGILARKPFEELPARTGYLTLLATIPAGVVGLLGKDYITAAFNSPRITSLFLLGTAALLVASEFLGKRNRQLETLNHLDALWIGLFQALSVFPGISRSGSTIAGGMTRHFSRKTAGQFAFLMAIPIMLLAGSFEVTQMISRDGVLEFLPALLIGFATAALSGFFAIRWLLKFISQHSLLPFAAYCFILGAGSFILSFTQPRLPILTQQNLSQEEAIFISYEPDLEWMIPIMNSCLSDGGREPIILQQQSYRPDIYSAYDVFLSFGEKATTGRYSYLLGEDLVLPVVNSTLALSNLPDQIIGDIYEGRLKTWDEVYAICPTCFESALQNENRTIRVYAFPEDSPISQTFNEAVLQASPSAPNIQIVPTAEAMLSLIALDENSIGYLPEPWIGPSLAVATAIDDTDTSYQISIIAGAQQEPQGLLRNWLTCIQTELKNR